MGRRKSPHKSIIGQRYGYWVVLELIDGKYRMIKCVCDCGNVKVVREHSVLIGDSTSCGCFAIKMCSERTTTHGLSKNPLYKRWLGALNRCTDSRRKDYKHYGGRGIKLSPEWSSNPEGIIQFIEDMGESFREGLELDRIDVNGDYCKENCRWVDRKTQTRNRREGFNHYIEYDGHKKCLAEWAEILGMDKEILGDRLVKLQWTVEKAFNTPIKVRRAELCTRLGDFTVSDIFKNPPNFCAFYKRNKLSIQQMLHYLFSSVGEIWITVNKSRMQYLGGDYVVKEKWESLPIFTDNFKQVLEDLEYVPPQRH